MQAVLVMFRNDGERRSFSITRDMTIIGRRQDCDLMIPLGEISRKHCRIIRDGEELRLEDLGSSNGTLHNGRRVQEVVLSAGDTIQVGPISFVLQLDGHPTDDEIAPHTGEPQRAGHHDTGHGSSLEATPEDDMERTPANELDVLGDDAPTQSGIDDDALEVLSGDDEAGGHDLDAEIDVIGLEDDSKLEVLEDSAAGEVTLEADEAKPRRK